MEPAPVARTVAERVRRLRRQRGWTAQQLADACAEAGLASLTRGTIAKIESGVRQSVTDKEVSVLARVLGVTTKDLLPNGSVETTGRSRLLVGRELRKARAQAGMTQNAAAEVLGCSQAKINKIETTHVEVSWADLDLLLDAYRVDPATADRLRQLVASERSRPRPPPDLRSPAFRLLCDLEPDASEILCWHSEGIPGPLQSEQYMLRQLNADGESTLEGTRLMEVQLARARMFMVENPPRYRVILSESSLHRMPGGRSPELVLEQVKHLLIATQAFPRLSLQIITFEAPIRYTPSDFVVLRFAGNEEDDFAYIEYPGDARILRKVEPFAEHWGELQDAALSQEESMKFLIRLAKETMTRS